MGSYPSGMTQSDFDAAWDDLGDCLPDEEDAVRDISRENGLMHARKLVETAQRMLSDARRELYWLHEDDAIAKADAANGPLEALYDAVDELVMQTGDEPYEEAEDEMERARR